MPRYKPPSERRGFNTNLKKRKLTPAEKQALESAMGQLEKLSYNDQKFVRDMHGKGEYYEATPKQWRKIYFISRDLVQANSNAING